MSDQGDVDDSWVIWKGIRGYKNLHPELSAARVLPVILQEWWYHMLAFILPRGLRLPGLSFPAGFHNWCFFTFFILVLTLRSILYRYAMRYS
jgi:hypothetical protein